MLFPDADDKPSKATSGAHADLEEKVRNLSRPLRDLYEKLRRDGRRLSTMGIQTNYGCTPKQLHDLWLAGLVERRAITSSGGEYSWLALR